MDVGIWRCGVVVAALVRHRDMIVGIQFQKVPLLPPLFFLQPQIKCPGTFHSINFSCSSYQSLVSTTQNRPLSVYSSLHPFSWPTVEIGIFDDAGGSIPGNGGNGNGNKNRPRPWWYWWKDSPCPSEPDDWKNDYVSASAALLACLWSVYQALLPSVVLASSVTSCSGASVWEVKGGKWTRLSPDSSCDSFVFEDRERGLSTSSSSLLGPGVGVDLFWQRCKDLFFRLMLPEGYPGSVSADYIEYSLWRAAQGIASQISGVLSTQVLHILRCCHKH